MKKKVGKNKQRSTSNYKSVVDSDEESEVPQSIGRNARGKLKLKKPIAETSSDDSDAGDFLNNKDKILLDEASDQDDSDLYSETEEVMPLGDSDNESEDEDEQDSFFDIKAKKVEMESDLEDEADDDDIPPAEAWGKKKSLYYNTDYVDKDFRKYLQQDEEAALAEEEEALAAQRRMLQDINEADLGFDIVQEASEEVDRLRNLQETEKLEVDTSKLSKEERLKLLKRASPEMLSFITDFKSYLSEAKDVLEPILILTKRQDYQFLQSKPGYQLLELKYHVILRYTANITFYMMLKSKKVPTKGHPVLKRLSSYKKLLKELDNLQKQTALDSEIGLILKSLESKTEILFSDKRTASDDEMNEEFNQRKKVKFNLEEEAASEEVDAETSSIGDENAGEMNSSGESEGEDGNMKRGITYEMAKNKGLTAKKKKELRNPRVKHRLKYRKALIRRKGQVREPRKEVSKYTGEISGIRSTVVKSVKFK